MKIRLLFLTLLGLVPAIAIAAATGNQAPSRPGGGDGSARGHGERPDRRSGGSAATRPDFDEEEWKLAVEFYRQNAPNRWAIIDPNLKAGGGRRWFLVEGYRRVQWLSGDHDMFSNAVDQIRLEDKIFGLAQELAKVREAKNQTEERRIKEDLRPSIAGLVDLQLQERRLRIERIRAGLKEEEGRVGEAAAERDRKVEEYLNETIEKNSLKWLRQGGRRGGGGGGPGGGPGPGGRGEKGRGGENGPPPATRPAP